MKKYTIIFAVIGILMSACSSDDDAGNNIDSEKLIATWIATTITVEGETFSYDDHEDCGFDTVNFQDNAQGIQIDVFECEEIVTPFTYTLKDNILEVSSGVITLETEILELSSDTLIFQSEWDYDDDGDTELVIETYESAVTISE